ncbi:MAG TPA: TauD/TfdA family dioxygenase [Nocardioides sp.]|uniref:TauD/TfdA family dioxygenase n=1 Tax=Nocardioides sp. TaxID=35761 RepID=UPI002D7F4D71|nr:TauD/TfdA family dioxygenase [Nocardioides sp.]HET6654563.1 TauD/TfdA family dioxygenase [Nocardioides sp.]
MREPVTSAARFGAENWSHRLSSQHVDEIDAALADVGRSDRPLLTVRARDFAVPRLAAELGRIVNLVEQRDGFAVVRGLDAGRYNVHGLRMLLWAMGQHLGTPVPQTTDGHMLRSVPATADAGFHSGGSDVSAFLVTGAGASASFVSSESLVREVHARRPDLAERLSGRYAFDRGAEPVPGELPYRLLPLTCRAGGRLSMRYRRDEIEAAHARPDLPSLGSADLDLFDLVDEIASDRRYRVDVQLDAGDLVLVDNYSTLHMLGAENQASPQLLRLWLTLPTGRDLPTGFTWESPGYGGRGGRGGAVPRDVISLPSGCAGPKSRLATAV